MKIKVTQKERNHILAALRMWQCNPELAHRAEALMDIATNCGSYDDLMSEEEIDALCERINRQT